MSIIEITRDSGWVDRIRKYKVVVNKKCIGKIGNGETSSFSVQAGQNEIYLKIDWCRSNKIQMDIASGHVVTLSCASNLRGLKIYLSIIYILFLPHKYIRLQRYYSPEDSAVE